jgi:hypothetical protein
MFKRLNTGGEELSDQEVRNCTVRLLDTTFNDFITQLSQNADFANCVSIITDKEREQKFAQELVLRFFAFKNDRERYVHDVGDFMTEYMEAVSDPQRQDVTFDYVRERNIFERTFAILNATLGDQAFSGYTNDGRRLGRFLSYHYEAFALGIQPYLDSIDLSDDSVIQRLAQRLDEIKRDPVFIKITTGGGKNYAKPLQERIQFVENRIADVL